MSKKRYCQHCGHPQESSFAKYCSSCGEPLDGVQKRRGEERSPEPLREDETDVTSLPKITKLEVDVKMPDSTVIEWSVKDGAPSFERKKFHKREMDGDEGI